jgi:hypothetical protein
VTQIQSTPVSEVFRRPGSNFTPRPDLRGTSNTGVIAIQIQSRGFTTVIALVAVGLVGFTLAGLMMRISSQAHRTVYEAEHAQLRQLVIAGQLQSQNATQPNKIHLPDRLARDGYSLMIQPANSSTTIQAKIGSRLERIVTLK